AHRVMVVCLRSTDFVEVFLPEIQRLVLRATVGGRGEHEGAVEAAFRRGTVIADDEIDQRIVEYAEFLERVDDATGVEGRVLKKRRVDLHLVRKDRPAFRGNVTPCGNAFGAWGEHPIGGDRHNAL